MMHRCILGLVTASGRFLRLFPLPRTSQEMLRLWPLIVQTDRGHEQARAGGEQIRNILQSGQETYKLFFYMSPYKRSKQTYEGIAAQFGRNIVAGTQEEVQLREQDFGNFQVSCCLAYVMQALSLQRSSCGNRTLAISRSAAVWHLSGRLYHCRC